MEFASELSREELAIVKQSYFELFEEFVAVFTKGQLLAIDFEAVETLATIGSAKFIAAQLRVPFKAAEVELSVSQMRRRMTFYFQN